MDAVPDVPRILQSPVFSEFAFPPGGATQYADAMLRTTFPKADAWHTLLGKPEVKPAKITVPVGYGYILTSKKTGALLRRRRSRVPAEGALQATSETGRQARHRRDA